MNTDKQRFVSAKPMCYSASVVCGIDFVPPVQGLNWFWGRESQGVALGCHVSRFQRNEHGGQRKDRGGQRNHQDNLYGNAPKALNKIAQGNALGFGSQRFIKP